MAELDLDEIEQEFLRQCGSCDFGLDEYGCQCATRDYRPTMLRLVEEVQRLRLQFAGEARTEWGVRYPELHPEPVQCVDEDMARHAAAYADGRVLMRRTVHTGPWREVLDAAGA